VEMFKFFFSFNEFALNVVMTLAHSKRKKEKCNNVLDFVLLNRTHENTFPQTHQSRNFNSAMPSTYCSPKTASLMVLQEGFCKRTSFVNAQQSHLSFRWHNFSLICGKRTCHKVKKEMFYVIQNMFFTSC